MVYVLTWSNSAYPTPYIAYGTAFTWDALLPTAVNDTSCCWRLTTHSLTPTHDLFPSPTGATNISDPSGWLYKLTGANSGSSYLDLYSTEISSLWGFQPSDAEYTGCGYTICDITTTAAAGNGVQVTQAFLLATSTTTISASSTAAQASSIASAQPSSVTADPLTAVDSSTPSATMQSTTDQPTSEADPLTAGSTTEAPPSSNTALSSNTPEALSAEQPSGVAETTDALESSPTSTSDSRTLPATSSGLSSTESPSNAVQSSSAQQPSSDAQHSSILQPQSTEPAASSEAASSNQDVAGALLSLLPSLLVASSESQAKSTSIPQGAQPITQTTSQVPVTPSIVIGTNTFTQQPDSAFVVSDQTLAVGCSITVGSGASIMVIALQTDDSSNTVLQVGSEQASTVVAAMPQAPTQAGSTSQNIVVAGETITVDSSSGFVISGQTLLPGSSITIGSDASATVLALQTDEASNTVLHVGTHVSTLLAGPAATSEYLTTTAPQVIVVGGSTLTAGLSSDFVVSGQTLLPGSSITVGSGISTSLVALQTDEHVTVLQVDSSASTLQPPSSAGMTEVPVPPQPIVIGSDTISADASSQYIVQGHTLVPGSSVTIGSGTHTTVIALQTSGAQTLVVLGSSTSTLPHGTMSAGPRISGAFTAFTLGSSVITPDANTDYMIASQTLQPGGPAITVADTILSLASGATELLVGANIGSEASLGGYIWSGLDGATATSVPSLSADATTGHSIPSDVLGSGVPSGGGSSRTPSPTSIVAGARPSSTSSSAASPGMLIDVVLAGLCIAGLMFVL